METIPTCGACDANLSIQMAFCPNCGAKQIEKEIVALFLYEVRVEYGSRNLEELPSDFFYVPVDSEIARTANLPFDASRIPAEGSLVPADCIWAITKHPGPFRPDMWNKNLETKVSSIAEFTGRTLGELVSFFGKPLAVAEENGIKSVVWGTSGFSKIWQVNLVFDRYEVCIAITNITDERI
jgi:hypothetical protein